MQGFFESLVYQFGHPIVFNSVMFMILFTFFYVLYLFVFHKPHTRNIFLLLFSLYFYYKVSGLFVFMLIIMATSDYFIGLWMFYLHKQSAKRLLLFLSLLVNVGYLSYFKYATFLLELFNIHIQEKSYLIEEILLPIGISYFVFRSLTYIFDLYREVIDKPEENYISYLLYVSFFPTILAGPIVKARELLPQLSDKLKISDEMISNGFFLIMCGAFKKIVISDYIANNFVNRVFDGPTLFTGFENLMAAYGAAIQLYCDFSGYTDIVLGIALLLGFKLSPNFNRPFAAVNVADFWRRWHMTLSSWMNDYLFYPLSYSFRKLKVLGVVIAVLITFFISGLWHGPNWTFIVWGSLHGLAIAFDVMTRNFRERVSSKLPLWLYRGISIFITFHFIVFTIVLFKSDSVAKANEMYSMIVSQFDVHVIAQFLTIYTLPMIAIGLGYVLHFLPNSVTQKTLVVFSKTPLFFKAVILFIVFVLIIQVFSTEALPFIYLEF